MRPPAVRHVAVGADLAATFEQMPRADRCTPGLARQALVLATHKWPGESFANENLPHVLAVGFEHAAAAPVVAKLSAMSSGEARAPDLGQIKAAPAYNHS
jgi:hypothetical protein